MLFFWPFLFILPYLPVLFMQKNTGHVPHSADIISTSERGKGNQPLLPDQFEP
jgi:hypothetical protein